MVTPTWRETPGRDAGERVERDVPDADRATVPALLDAKVAELTVPVEAAARILEPDFLKDKRKFYGWLDRNPRYCKYDRRRTKTISDRFFNMGGLDGADEHRGA